MVSSFFLIKIKLGGPNGKSSLENEASHDSLCSFWCCICLNFKMFALVLRFTMICPLCVIRHLELYQRLTFFQNSDINGLTIYLGEVAQLVRAPDS